MTRPTCILVMGMARSGTSMTAGILYHLGVDMGPSVKGNQFNQKGFFEDIEFTNLHSEIIGTTHMDYLSKALAVEEMPARWLAYYRVMIDIREKKAPLWGLKDPRLFLFIGEFLDLLCSRLKVIRVTRNPQAIFKSLKGYRAGWRVPNDDRLKHLINQWINLRDRAVAKTEDYRDECMTVAYEQAVKQPKQTVDQIADFVGVPPTPAALNFIDPSLDHSKR